MSHPSNEQFCQSTQVSFYNHVAILKEQKTIINMRKRWDIYRSYVSYNFELSQQIFMPNEFRFDMLPNYILKEFLT